MSTYYYAVCDKCRIVSDVLGGRSFPYRWWQNDEGELADFLSEHGDCKPAPQIVSEYDGRTDDYATLPEPLKHVDPPPAGEEPT